LSAYLASEGFALPSQPRQFLAVLALVSVQAIAAAGPTRADPLVDKQRQLFISVYDSVEQGDWSAVDALSPADTLILQDYDLWPDLQAAYWRATLDTASPTEIEAYLQRYGALRPARELRYRLALHRAENGDLQGFQRIYEQFYQGQEITRLDCLSLQAELDRGRAERVILRATELWLVGRSQVSECDPVFDYLYEQNLLGDAEYRQRFELAITAREFQLARWLARRIDPQHELTAALWIRAQTNPEDFLHEQSHRSGRNATPGQLVYAAERLTYRDPEKALAAWKEKRRSEGKAGPREKEPMGPEHFQRPSGLYETMFRTIPPFAFKGVIFYQGESNALALRPGDPRYAASR